MQKKKGLQKAPPRLVEAPHGSRFVNFTEGYGLRSLVAIITISLQSLEAWANGGRNWFEFFFWGGGSGVQGMVFDGVFLCVLEGPV